MIKYRVTMAIPSVQLWLAWKREPPVGYIQFAGHLAQGGRNSSWNQVKSIDGEFINAHLKLDWAYLSTGGLIWQTHQPIHWHIGPKLIQMSQTCWGEREGEIPHKGCSRSTLDLILSPPSVKDLSDLVNLLQIWLISIKSAENPLIYWFWICSIIHQFIN